MTKLEEPSFLEKMTGSVVTRSVATALSTCIGTPLGALLPVLLQSLAFGRHNQRVENALEDINQILNLHEDKIRQLSDSQYKIINEIILTILQTTEQEKIKYLKIAIKNTLKEDRHNVSVATLISRILRDITLDEIMFLIKNAEYSRIIFSDKPMNDRELFVDVHSRDGIIVSGLISLGLMVPGAATFDDIGRYQYSPLVNEVIGIIKS